jgi:hypothetical protein
MARRSRGKRSAIIANIAGEAMLAHAIENSKPAKMKYQLALNA